ncbi:hypothetical protein DICSQDRAFT_167737 [Dichomitus squalens LYAD-421 SS1]|uniref:uncharacterized protein n=1 Tax=Dichomitus squalens (strain LYAD-421) TaxID=732165 RepID=UPI0004415F12|nr:uncharacterized protein DICSQDRAFT_167737 [Dichomitus squalens LYAD-421 SS1]EJF63684.1 hypothetical protein DICSQDRAFT_167737 [Dichomitus squalens LYAD-421 SS1]
MFAPRDAVPRVDNHWRERLRDLQSGSVVSVRDVKEAEPDYKLNDPLKHDFARYVLPVTESEIKTQMLKCPTVSTNDAAQNVRLPPSDSYSDNDERQAYLDQLRAEFETISGFQSDLGKPSTTELQGLDGDALEQLESDLSTLDQNYPDSWIPRSSELLRLTGKHPLNAEPNLHALFQAGMITPTKLHYVRNHGAVPQLNWETHTFVIYVDPSVIDLKLQECTYSMYDLTGEKFNHSVIEIPVTLGCDGNRRKEMNMVKRTKGFGWTASGVSTAVWRGVPLVQVLRDWGLTEIPAGKRWYLNFEGAEMLPEGPYATSIPLEHALNPINDVLLAFGMNGRVLHPDHGYPLRVIIPGYVGGRQVKWLKKIWITAKPNDSYYHLFDNKVVPSFITSTSDPVAQAFFRDESTACWEQTLQSVICEPAHDERLELTDKVRNGKYTVRGLAYNGGGERIERVELSVDGGKTWKYCFRHFTDKPLRHADKWWTWIFWSCDVPIQEIVDGSGDIIVRAHDQKKNFQPENITWTLTGMMNNAWYRVRRTLVKDHRTSTVVMRFQHPVAPGEETTGWMIPPTDEGIDMSVVNKTKKLPTYELDDVQKHDKEDDAWIILDYDKVYDLNRGPNGLSILSQHPGGPRVLLKYAGKATVNASLEYDQIHDNRAHEMRAFCLIGRLSAKGVAKMKEDYKCAKEELRRLKEQQRGYALQPDVFIRAMLRERVDETSSVRRYTFEIPSRNGTTPAKLGLPVGRHVQIAVHFEDQAVVRSYTPIFPILPEEDTGGTFQLLVKTYFPDKVKANPGGTVSNYLDCLQKGQEIDIRGPMGDITYNISDGVFDVRGQKLRYEKINLLAGGTGITPIWQLIHAVLSTTSTSPQLNLINCNTSGDDILLYADLERHKGDRLKIWNVLSDPSKARHRILDPKDYIVGRVNAEIMHVFTPVWNYLSRLTSPRRWDHFEAPSYMGGHDTVATFIAAPALTKWRGRPVGFVEWQSLFIF